MFLDIDVIVLPLPHMGKPALVVEQIMVVGIKYYKENKSKLIA